MPASKSGTAICLASRSRLTSSCLRTKSWFLRKRSIARRLAITISHAPGLSGTPEFGHCSSATTSASCARSSARPTSLTMRVSPAMTFGDSIFQTASIVGCISVAVTATDHIMFSVLLQPYPADDNWLGPAVRCSFRKAGAARTRHLRRL